MTEGTRVSNVLAAKDFRDKNTQIGKEEIELDISGNQNQGESRDSYAYIREYGLVVKNCCMNHTCWYLSGVPAVQKAETGRYCEPRSLSSMGNIRRPYLKNKTKQNLSQVTKKVMKL